MINIVDEEGLEFPNLVEVFEQEIKNIYAKLGVFSDFNSTDKFIYSTSYYCLGMIIQYQEQGSGKVPQYVLEDIIKQVVEASKKVFLDFTNNEEIWSFFKKTIYEKIIEINIINETKLFWEKYQF